MKYAKNAAKYEEKHYLTYLPTLNPLNPIFDWFQVPINRILGMPLVCLEKQIIIFFLNFADAGKKHYHF